MNADVLLFIAGVALGIAVVLLVWSMVLLHQADKTLKRWLKDERED